MITQNTRLKNVKTIGVEPYRIGWLFDGNNFRFNHTILSYYEEGEGFPAFPEVIICGILSISIMCLLHTKFSYERLSKNRNQLQWPQQKRTTQSKIENGGIRLQLFQSNESSIINEGRVKRFKMETLESCIFLSSTGHH